MTKRVLATIAVVAFLLTTSTVNATTYLDFTGNLSIYSGQPSSGSYNVLGGGTEVELINNIWTSYYLPLTVGEETILTFSYKSSEIPEIAGIGFDYDNSFSNTSNNFFITWGTQAWGTNQLNYTDTGNYTTYSIDLTAALGAGSTFNYLVLLNDDDGNAGGDGVSNSYFKAVSVTPIPGALWLLGSGLLGLVGTRKVFRK